MTTYLPNMAAYKEAIAAPHQRIEFVKSSVTVVANRQYTLWRAAGVPAPGLGFYGTTMVATDNLTVGALPIRTPSNTMRVVRTWFSFATQGYGTVMLHDRYSHNSGLSGQTTGDITIDSPALPARAGGGKNVRAAAEIWVTIGGTASTLALNNYTNHTGATLRAGPGVTFGSTGWRDPPRWIPLALAPGDSGISTIQTVNLSVSTVGTGDYGIVVYKTLLSVPFNGLAQRNPEEEGLFGMGLVMPKVEADACLFQTISFTATTTGVFQGYYDLAEMP